MTLRAPKQCSVAGSQIRSGRDPRDRAPSLVRDIVQRSGRVSSARRASRGRSLAGGVLLLQSLILVGCGGGSEPLFMEAAPLAPLPSIGSPPSGSLRIPSGPTMPPGSAAGASGAGAAPGAGGADGPGSGAAGPPRADAGTDPDQPSGAGASGTGGASGVAEPPPNDDSCGAQCVSSGGRCFEGTCHFDCAGPDSCTTGQVLCPAGRPCEVHCGDRSCAENVVCGERGECNIVCEGESSCAREVICEGECQVTCSGASSCRGGVGGSVALMQLDCSGANSCGGTVSCEGQDCQLSCSGTDSCARIRTLAVQNVVSCSGAGSCGTDVNCLGAFCDVECASDACASGVDCRALDCATSSSDNGEVSQHHD
jgi:hypothetical protein